KPVEALLDPEDKRWNDYPVLKDALQPMPIKRDHVKFNHRGVRYAKKQGKFDRTSLTMGHRFSIELSLWSDYKDNSCWDKLIKLLQRPDFRLGGGTRRGLGKLKIVRCHKGMFNLRDRIQYIKFTQLTQSVANTTHLQAPSNLRDRDQYIQFTELTQSVANTTHLQPLVLTEQPLAQMILNLTPLDGYRFGGGVEKLTQNSQADLLAVTEPCVEWKKNRGSLSQKRIVIPASGVKGALSHRVAYHYNALTGIFADDNAVQAEPWVYLGENNRAVKTLFGYVEEKQSDKKEVAAQMGCLIFDDVYIDRSERQQTLQPVEYTHNGIDRFTGGVREGVLFVEVVTDTQPFKLNITVALPAKRQPTPEMWQALHLALTDLVEGDLALGAGGGRGHGYFEGSWITGKEWLESKINKETLDAT
ncbi:MAG: RAMP superfamily CRISPR-associated protein, partial [Candidatus Parabeggiatoa sp.]|nr:RAMP superfamily CRISPR-associated protein [Candidatus Parabeggiatoa sp.]